jgi:N-acetyl-anhydromuramyl-L-alanine amidase AmpD
MSQPDRAGVVWVGARADRVNYAQGRSWLGVGQRIVAVVLHTSVGSLESMRNFFTFDAVTSAHYGISSSGDRIYQFVREKDTAFHAGRVLRPKASLVKRRLFVNPNVYTIGIEHADDGFPNGPRQRGQLEASASLIARICAGYGIRPGADTIIPHNAIYAEKSCPGSLPVADIIQMVKDRLS